MFNASELFPVGEQWLNLCWIQNIPFISVYALNHELLANIKTDPLQA